MYFVNTPLYLSQTPSLGNHGIWQSQGLKTTCPPPLFNLQEAQGAGGLVGPLGEDSSSASS
jgi:hypothetical protein